MKRESDKNLIPLDRRDAEDRRRIASEGGKKSGEARRKRKATKDLIRAVLSMNVDTTRKAKNALKKLGYDVDKEGAPSVELLMQINIANRAMAGDIACAKFLYDYAQIPDIKAQLERERMQAIKEGRARVDLTVNSQEEAEILREIERRMTEATGNSQQATGEPETGETDNP